MEKKRECIFLKKLWERTNTNACRERSANQNLPNFIDQKFWKKNHQNSIQFRDVEKRCMCLEFGIGIAENLAKILHFE